MYGISEVSRLTGVSKRTLQYYDQIGLLKPAQCTEAGYRLYDAASLERLQQILLYRELEFPLKEIRRILDSTDYDRNRALEQQIELLTMKKEHLENLIMLAAGLKGNGTKYMDFSAFDTRRIDEYARQARENWGNTKEYKEFEQKQKGRNEQQEKAMMEEFMQLFVRFGTLRNGEPSAPAAQAMVQELKDYISEHFYQCSDQVLSSLGKMYSGGGSMNENIDAAGGKGTGAFVCRAIEHYCVQNKE